MSESWNETKNSIIDIAKVKRIPLMASFELTARCNFQCKMCYVSKANDKTAMQMELTAEQWIDIGRQARDAGLLFLTFTGGEIFLRKDFRTIYEAYSQMGIRISFYTNGSLITKEVAQWLKKIPPELVSITIYGANPETYYKITGNRYGFDKTMSGIQNVYEAGLNLELKTTVVKGNIDEFDDISAIAKKFNTVTKVVNYVSPRREGDNSDPLGNRLSPERLSELEDKIIEYNRNAVNKVKAVDDMENPITAEIDRITESDIAFKCLSGRCSFWVNWRGDVTPCGLLNEPSLNAVEHGFIKAWEHLVKEAKKIPECQDCITCKYKYYCMKCPARLYNETGSFNQKAPYLCAQAKMTYEKYQV